MNGPDLLEERLRRGLQAAADALPPADRGGHPGHPGRRPSRTTSAKRQRPWLFEAAIGVAAAAAVVAGVLVVRQLNDEPEVETEPSAPAPTSTPSTAPTSTTPGSTSSTTTTVPVASLGAGGAVIVGDELRTYGPDGTETGSRSLATATHVQAASSDGADGWVVCGGTTGAGESTSQLIWFPAGRDYQILDAQSPACGPRSVRVVASPDGPVAVYQSGHTGPVESPDDYAANSLRAITLATGADRDTGLGHGMALDNRWSAAAGRVALYDEASGVGIYDLASGELLGPAPQPVDLFRSNAVELAPDGRSLAAIVGGNMAEEVSLVVWDLERGGQVLSQPLDIQTSAEMQGVQLAYDGTAVAYGNSSDAYPPVTVVDVDSGQQRTVDAHGILPSPAG